jgi:hypothetical protein
VRISPRRHSLGEQTFNAYAHNPADTLLSAADSPKVMDNASGYICACVDGNSFSANCLLIRGEFALAWKLHPTFGSAGDSMICKDNCRKGILLSTIRQI